MRALANHPWPGNIRELQNVITRLVLTCGDAIRGEDVRQVLGKTAAKGVFSSALLRSRSLSDLQLQLEREFLLQLHADEDGNLKAMAAKLGITRRALYDRFRRVGLQSRELR